MKDYQALNERLQQLLAGFDLNQNIGGCSVSVFHRGHTVATVAHGIAQLDKATGNITPWRPDTLSLNFSTGKGVLVTLIHVIVSQGLLTYDAPIAQYWQDFAQSSKQQITLRDVLSHEAGLFDIHQVTDHAKDMLDWQTMLTRVAKMPVYPGDIEADQSQGIDARFVAYSALVSGWVLGGLIEQVTAKTLQQALEHYLLTPLGLVGQVYFGVPSEKLPLVAGQMREKEGQNKPTLTQDNDTTLAFYQSQPMYPSWLALAYPQGFSDNNANPLTTQAINSLYFTPAAVQVDDYKSALVPVGSRQFNYYHPASLQAVIPAANGVASSVALATIYAMLANGGQWQGKTLIEPAIFKQATQLQNSQPDKIMPATMLWRLGYHRVFARLHDVSNAFGHMGYNGSVAWCDPSRELAVAFTHNYDVTMLNDVRQFLINETILDFFD